MTVNYFKWEDAPALGHHCAICARPLNHRGARLSCFGKHAEPCPRYHQQMFRAGRGRSCHWCGIIESEHHKRHVQLAGTLRSILEICGEDAYIGDSNIMDETRARTCGHEDARPPEGDTSWSKDTALHEDGTSTNGDSVNGTRKEKKLNKNLTKAATRAKVVTAEEYQFMSAVLHPAQNVHNDTEAPRNLQDIREMERKLRDHADLFLKKIGTDQIMNRNSTSSDIGLNFEAEMEHIESAFNITAFIKRNEKNRGLQGKDLKMFGQLLDSFRKAVTEDLILVRLDDLNAEMRKAGYLRYTTIASHELVEERYQERDRKTGDRILDKESDGNDHEEHQKENILPDPVRDISPQSEVDLRHLQFNHKRIPLNGDDSGDEIPALPNDNEPVPLFKQKSKILRIIPNGVSTPNHGPWKTGTAKSYNAKPPTYKSAATPRVRTYTPAIPSRPSNPFVDLGFDMSSAESESMDGYEESIATTDFSEDTRRTSVDDQLDQDQEPLPVSEYLKEDTKFGGVSSDALKRMKKAQREEARKARRRAELDGVQANDMATPAEAEAAPTEDHDTLGGAPPVSAKSEKKKKREAERKARRDAEQEASKTMPAEASDAKTMQSSSSSGKVVPKSNEHVASREELAMVPTVVRKKHDADHAVDKAVPASSTPDLPSQKSKLPAPTDSLTPASASKPPPTPSKPPVTNTNKSHDWTKYTHQLTLDTMTDPFKYAHCCTHQCPYVPLGFTDCPSHGICSDVDPMLDWVMIVYPTNTSRLCSGPYTRPRAEKLLELYNADPHVSGQFMLLDSATWDYLTQPKDPMFVSERYAMELKDMEKGYGPGPLMQQEKKYNKLASYNSAWRQPITQTTLKKLAKKFEPEKTKTICYCMESASKPVKEGDTIECGFAKCKIGRFHRKCVSGMMPEAYSRWYCFACSAEMDITASKVLRETGGLDVIVKSNGAGGCPFEGPLGRWADALVGHHH